MENILLIRPARLIAFGFIILSCGRFKDSFTKVLVLSFCTRQETHPLLSKGGNQGALVLVELSFQISSCPLLPRSFFSCFHHIRAFHISFFSVSTSNLATHIVGSLKKGKSLTPIPATTYNTLPSNHSLSNGRTNSEGMISSNLSLPPAHKRSPSSDSGNAGSRSHTPVSYHMGEKSFFLSVRFKSCLSAFLQTFPLTICTSLQTL